MRIEAKPNGAFTITGGGLRLIDCLPGMDGRAIQPVSVDVDDRGDRIHIVYDLLKGRIVLELSCTDGAVTLDATLEGMPIAPHWVHPIHSARIEGAIRFFRQGLGFSGPTNFVSLTGRTDPISFESYMTSALEAADGRAMAIHTCANRDYLAKTQVHSRIYRAEFRNRRVDATDLFLESGFSSEGVPVPADGLRLPTITLTEADTSLEAVTAASQAIAQANHARVPDKTRYYYCSWYMKRMEFCHADLERVLAGARAKDLPLDFIQIDDGYQPFWGDWLEANERWPQGMAEAAKAIRDAGYEAGLWVAPMAVEQGSRIMREHPDWLLRDLDGKPILKMKGGAYAGSNDRHALDLSHPQVIDRIREVFTTLHEWGFTCFKTDFMDWGYADSLQVQRHTPGKTSAQWFDLALRTIRESIGPDSYWLACISYFPPFVGYCDGMRVSSDVGEVWNPSPGDLDNGATGGIMNSLQESFHCQSFNNVLWQNDPDVIFLRDEDIKMSDTEIRSLALWAGMLGAVIATSDFFDALRDDRLALWRFLDPGSTRINARLPYWGRTDQPLYVAIRDYDRGHALLVFNPTPDAQEAEYLVAELFGSASVTCRTWGPQGAGPAESIERLGVRLASHESALYWVGPDDPPATLTPRLAAIGDEAAPGPRRSRRPGSSARVR